MLNTLAKQLEEQGEVVFKHNGTTVAILETDQGDENIRGEEYMNYMYNLYDTYEFETDEDAVEYDGGLCEGTPKDAIEMAIEQVTN
ncbi:MAG: hypothetical protein PHI38_07100 [Sulfurimonas sp.]|uniref:hypothetical protein n=1 Tax=Sulfurimonas sp. TaxID=2022749 RepID=UPI0026257674|nr:hypothetical protein [Sulfurimonas sp.]MDD3476620.1 hypothetical protein [Sulfurimonas sp.]